MKKLIIACMLAISFGATAAIAAANFQVRDDLRWSVAKSPQTGRCYEIADRSNAMFRMGYGYMGMSEIPCEEAGL